MSACKLRYYLSSPHGERRLTSIIFEKKFG